MMADTLKISRPNNAPSMLTLENGKASVTWDVSNLTDTTIIVRASIAPPESKEKGASELVADSAWLTLHDEAERNIPSRGHGEQFTVTVSVPDDAAAGTYGFSLKVEDATSAAGITYHSGDIDFQVPSRPITTIPTPPPRRIPWLWIAIAAAVVLLIGLTIWRQISDAQTTPAQFAGVWVNDDFESPGISTLNIRTQGADTEVSGFLHVKLNQSPLVCGETPYGTDPATIKGSALNVILGNGTVKLSLTRSGTSGSNLTAVIDSTSSDVKSGTYHFHRPKMGVEAQAVRYSGSWIPENQPQKSGDIAAAYLIGTESGLHFCLYALDQSLTTHLVNNGVAKVKGTDFSYSVAEGKNLFLNAESFTFHLSSDGAELTILDSLTFFFPPVHTSIHTSILHPLVNP